MHHPSVRADDLQMELDRPVSGFDADSADGEGLGSTIQPLWLDGEHARVAAFPGEFQASRRVGAMRKAERPDRLPQQFLEHSLGAAQFISCLLVVEPPKVRMRHRVRADPDQRIGRDGSKQVRRRDHLACIRVGRTDPAGLTTQRPRRYEDGARYPAGAQFRQRVVHHGHERIVERHCRRSDRPGCIGSLPSMSTGCGQPHQLVHLQRKPAPRAGRDGVIVEHHTLGACILVPLAV